MARTRKRSQSARPARAAAAPAASTAAATSAPTAMHVLSADLRIAACAAERDALLKASDGQDLMTVDGGAVTRVDATGLQLLVALCRHQRDRTLAAGERSLARGGPDQWPDGGAVSA
jgi:ABC-type transporter Mla MlaB component